MSLAPATRALRTCLPLLFYGHVGRSGAVVARVLLGLAMVSASESLAADNADAQTFNNQFLLFQVHFDGGEFGIFRDKPDFVAFALEALDRYFVIDAGYHDLA